MSDDQDREPDVCRSCFKTAEMEPVKVRRSGCATWKPSTIWRCANPECHTIRKGTDDDILDHLNAVYGYKYFGDYELSPEQTDAVWEALRLAKKSKLLAQALAEAEAALEEAERALEEIADNGQGCTPDQMTARAALTRIRAAKGGE